MQPVLQNYWSQWCDACQRENLQTDLIAPDELLDVFASSDFIARSLIQKPALLSQLLAENNLINDRTSHEYDRRLQQQLHEIRDDNQLMAVLRQFRRFEMVRIAWRDLAGITGTAQTLRELSWLADTCIKIPLEILYLDSCEKIGEPRDSQGKPVRPLVIGMGKLGAFELNFSSDIDLIFFYREQGEIVGKRAMANSEFLTRLMQRFVTVLNKTTVDGFVFRVDTRLRPFGDSGPLLMSFSGVEQYYQTQGRSWERYAMIKARVIYGDDEDRDELLEIMKPFVFRRYLDFGAFASIRKMKALIENEISSKGLQHNIKLGEGGIREIEFIGQAFQLIRGGREPQLQVRGIIDVLNRLSEHGDLPEQSVDQLLDSYEFLRKLENRLQMLADEQTHLMPADELARARICHAMRVESWEALEAECWKHRKRVHGHFEMVFAAPQVSDDSVNTEDFYHRLWVGKLDQEQVEAQLAAQGFSEPELFWQRISEFAQSSVVEHIGDTARKRLDQLMPMVIASLQSQSQSAQVLARVLEVLRAVLRRSVYLALLVEYPMALSQLVRLCAASKLITRLLTQYPILLDELLDPSKLHRLLKKPELEQQLAIAASRYAEDDLEQQMDVLRHFHHSQILKIAALDVAGDIDVFEISSQLSMLAELILHRVYQMAWLDMTTKFGQPVCELDDGQHYQPQLAVIAYGKLGGEELGYSSDLDIVFLHDSRGKRQQTNGERSLDNSVFFARMTQRIIHILSSYTNAGRLYEVDTRLRPDGNKGLLVSSLTAFEQYQLNQAWTWEHQALLRARVVVAGSEMREEFDRIRRTVLTRSRDYSSLQQEVREMREKMRQHLGSKSGQGFQLKQDRGGLVDIEFITQFSVLAHAAEKPHLLDKCSTIELVDLLADNGVWQSSRASLLVDCYRQYRELSHQRALDEAELLFDDSTASECRRQISAIWSEVLDVTL